MTATRQWSEELAAWAIDPELLAAAPESPYGFPVGLFGGAEGAAATRQVLQDVAPATLLDVGCGGGAASVGVGAGELWGVDESADLLAAFQEAAGGTPVRSWQGRWPDVAADVPVADAVVCADVVYNVPEVEAFVAELTRHARSRVVVELTDAHPWTSMAGLWRHVHGQERPSGPTAALFGDVLVELGIRAQSVTWPRWDPWRGAPDDVVLAFTRRRLCLPASRDPEVADAMARYADDRPRTGTTYWWDGAG